MSTRTQVRISLALYFSLFFMTNLLAGPVDDKVHGPSDSRIKFGVVVKNSDYLIYRSSALGKHGMKHLNNILEQHDLPFPKTIIYMNKQGYAFPLYFAIKEYKLSESEKYGPFDFFHSFGKPRTYVDGHNPYYPSEIIDSRRYLGPVGKRYFSYGDGKVAGGVDTVLNILKLVLDPERQPVLFHCMGGIHRTGMIAMALRFIQGGYWVEGPKTEKWGMQLNPAEYEYYKYNPVLFRKKNIEFIEQFSRDPRFLALQEQYQEALNGDEGFYFNDDDSSDDDLEDDNYAGVDD